TTQKDSNATILNKDLNIAKKELESRTTLKDYIKNENFNVTEKYTSTTQKYSNATILNKDLNIAKKELESKTILKDNINNKNFTTTEKYTTIQTEKNYNITTSKEEFRKPSVEEKTKVKNQTNVDYD